MRTRIAVVALAGAGLLAATGCTVNPVTGKSQLDLMGEAQEIELGKSLYPSSIQESLGPIEDEAVQALVGEVGGKLAAVSHRPALPYEFTAVSDPEVNAFALPGGKICITRGLLTRLESVDGMANVMGHEVGHVTARHAVAHYNRQILATAVTVGAMVYMGTSDSDYRGLIGLGAIVGSQLALAHYSREQERQSDDLGIDYAVKAGYSPRGMIETQRVLLSLQEKEPGVVERLFGSHPMSAERLATAEQQVEALPPEIRDRPLQAREYQAAVRTVIAQREAWDLAGEGRRLLGAEKVKEAESKLAEASRRGPQQGMIRTLHAVSLAMAERDDAAVAEAREGARYARKAFVAQSVGGQLLLKPDPAAALACFERAEEILPGQADIALLRGQALEKLGRKQEAVEAYRQAYERDPNGKVGEAAGKRLQALGAD
jgi:predicted Zn-dependent protease